MYTSFISHPSATFTRLALIATVPLLGACASGGDMDSGGSFGPVTTATSDGTDGGTGGDSSGESDGSSGGSGSAGGSSTGGPAEVCGDGTLDPGETCDDGNTLDGDGCQADCTPTPAGCGDKVAQPGELCHDLGGSFSVEGAGGVTLGDLDGDGDLDLVASEPTKNRVRRFLLEEASGTDEATFLAGVRPNLLDLYDLNDDGNPDLSARTGNPNDRGWSMLPGNGQGMFGAVEVGIDGGLYAYAVGNLNLDGIPDLVFSVPSFLGVPDVVVSLANYGLSVGNNAVYLDGWEAKAPIPFLAMADLDGDGRDDLVAASDTSPADYFIVKTSGTDGTFEAPTTLGAFPTPVDLVVHDLNSDGYQDVLAALEGQQQLLVLYLDENAGIDTIAYVPLDFEAQRLALGRFDAGSGLDLAAVTPQGTLELLSHVGGDALFGEGISVPLGEVPSQIAVGDVNDDGLDDLAVALPGAGQVQLVLSNP